MQEGVGREIHTAREGVGREIHTAREGVTTCLASIYGNLTYKKSHTEIKVGKRGRGFRLF